MMKACILFVILFGLLNCALPLCSAQELSKLKCDEYSRKNEALPEPNQYRKYMDKFVVARTFFKEYDAVLISEGYALTSVPASNELQFIAIIINNRSITVHSQEQQNGIYLIKLQFKVELYHKFVCLWHSEMLPVGYDFFTVEHETSTRIPFLRTYTPNTIGPNKHKSLENKNTFCLKSDNGRQHTETVFENQAASSLLFFKSFSIDDGINKNHYIMGTLQESGIIFGRKLWPDLPWIEYIVWKRTRITEQVHVPDCDNIEVLQHS